MDLNARLGKQYSASPLNLQDKQAIAKLIKSDPARVMASIIRNQHTQYAKDMAHWKAARDEAMNIDSPYRVLLTELYDDIDGDGFITGIVHHNRILRVANKTFKIVDFKTGKEDKIKTDLLKRAWVNKFIKLAMQSKFYGYSLIYFNEWRVDKKEWKDVKLVYREHVIPELEGYTIHQYDNEVIPMDRRYMIGVGDTEDLGLYDKAAPLWILKKHSWANWDEFEEIFGIPIRIAKTVSTDKRVLGEIESWLRTMGSAAYGIFPQDTEMDIKESKQTDAFEVFDRKRKAANEELEMLLMGVKNFTTENGTYGKQQEIGKDMDQVTEDDKTFIQHLINDELMPMLALNGYPFTDNDIFDWDDKRPDPKERLTIFEGVKRLGYQLDQEEVATDLGVNIMGEIEPEEEDDETEETEKAPAPGKGKTKPKPKNSGKVKNEAARYLDLNNKLNDIYFTH